MELQHSENLHRLPSIEGQGLGWKRRVELVKNREVQEFWLKRRKGEVDVGELESEVSTLCRGKTVCRPLWESERREDTWSWGL